MIGYQEKNLPQEECPALEQAAQGSDGVTSLEGFKKYVDVAPGDTV